MQTIEQEQIPESVFIEIAQTCTESEPKEIAIQRIMDSAVEQLGSGQDRVYTSHKKNESSEEWTMAVWDGHGNEFELNPYNGRYHKHNFTMLVLDRMITMKDPEDDSKFVIDNILERDIFSEEDPALALQRAFGEECIKRKRSMKHTGSTFTLVKVKHEFAERTIQVDILSVGDSTAVIYENGEKVFETVAHSPSNLEEIERLKNENRLNKREPFTNSRNFEVLNETTCCNKVSQYVNVQDLMLASTQSLGHLVYNCKELVDEKGIYGLCPSKRRIIFSDTADINIKLFSDGVSDIIYPNTIKNDMCFMSKSNARETVNLTKFRWNQNWKICAKSSWEKNVKTGEPIVYTNECFSFAGGGADDVCCVSWIQREHK